MKKQGPVDRRGGRADQHRDERKLGLDWVPIAVLIGAVFAILIVVAGSAMVGAAQENATTTTTVVENETESYAINVDGGGLLKVVSYDYDGTSFTIELEAERPTLVVVSDLGSAVSSGGARNIAQERKTIPRGRSTLVIDAGRNRGVATVSVASSKGAVALSSKDSEPLIGGNYTADDARVVGATSLGTGLVLVVGIFHRRRGQEGRGARRFL